MSLAKQAAAVRQPVQSSLQPGRSRPGQRRHLTPTAEALVCTPQALALRSYHFQKVGKKPELTLVWEPDDLEEEPTQQVSPPLGPKANLLSRA